MAELVATSIFTDWLDGLADATARSRIAKRLARIELGLMGDIRSVGGGVSEVRVDHGPGYRVYFTRRRQVVIVLLCGGDKGSQDRDIAKAQSMVLDL